jgi:hypothetical protein
MFRGSELPRLLVLLVIAAAGWAYVWGYAEGRHEPAEPPPVAGTTPAPIVADRSPEFETVRDKTPLSFRDSAAYARLLARARETPASRLAAGSRRDVFLGHLIERPAHYRGIAIHLLGTARRVLRYESALSRNGWLYEAWVFTPDSQNHPYVCVFEDPPAGFPIGADLSERVAFDGYFLKLLAYRAGDTARFAPVLVGRLGWTPAASGTGDSARGPVFWISAVLAALFLASLVRWVVKLRRFLAPRPRPSLLSSDRPHDDLSPEALAGFLAALSEDDAAGEAESAGPEPRSP